MKNASKTACWLIPTLALVAALYQLHLGWDDGAITAAFARTFVQSGKMALTPSSAKVEGFSSLLWMLILAVGGTVFSSANAMLVWTKIASATAFAASLFAFARVAKHFVSEELASFAVLLLALTITPFTETFNGMEMNLYMLLILLLSEVLIVGDDLFGRQLTLAGLLSFAILLTRFEAPYLLLFLYMGLWFSVGKRRVLLALIGLDVVTFGMIEYWRYSTFGEWLPNTIYAKRWAPYSPTGWKHQVMVRGLASWELVVILAFPLVILCVLWLVQEFISLQRASSSVALRIQPVLVSMSVGGILLGLLAGQNWGHPGRMVLAFLPYCLLTLALAFSTLAERNGLSLQRLCLVIVLGQGTVWMFQAAFVVRGNFVPYAVVEQTGLAADDLRQRLHAATLSIYVPDIGASALCCENLNIMDSALLANPSLARVGYAGNKRFVGVNRPEVIETHEPWSTLDKFYEGQVLDEYGLVQIRGMYLFVRNDRYQELLKSGYSEVSRRGNTFPCLRGAAPAELRSPDLLFLASRSSCILITEGQVGR